MSSSLTEQEQRWLSGKHVGTSTPVLKGYVRRGHLERHYANKPDDEVFCYVPGLKGPNAVWWAHWVAETEWEELPNIFTVSGENDFDQKGVEQITAEIDNVELAESTGSAGVFHMIERGFMAPTRGDAGFNQAAAGTANFWRGAMKDQSTQIILLAGYGEAFFPLFLGLVDGCDLTSKPDKITVTARSMGKVFTDQHVFQDAKNLFVKDPITFCDRQQADELENVCAVGNAAAKSNDGSHFARFAADQDTSTSWISSGYDASSGLDWIEFTVPNGRYEDFRLTPRFAGMEVFVSVYAQNDNVPGGGAARTTDEHELGAGWVSYEKIDNVPGTTIPYVAHYQQVSGEPTHFKIRKGGGGYVVGDSSRVRLWFTNLAKVNKGKKWVYAAGVTEVEIYKRVRMQAAERYHWILVDDVSDIVKTVCQWAGFSNPDDWEIERVGSRLKDKIVIDRSHFLVDIIEKVAEGTSYTFQVKPPSDFDVTHLDTEHNLSMGVVTFRQNQSMTPSPNDKRYAIRDDQTIMGIQPEFDGSPLAQSIRTRGKLKVTQKLIENPEYVPPPTGTADRFFYNYRPVWARDGSAQAGHGAAGIRKHEFHVDPAYSSDQDCKIACLLIAYREALEAAKGSVEIPLFPPVNLDQQITVYDLGTGLSTRLWIVSRDWNYSSGEERKFTMTLGGPLLDVDIVQSTREELKRALRDAGYDPAPIARGPWEEVHLF